MISVIINGKKYELEGSATLIEYLRSKGLADKQIAVAVNGTVVRRDEFEGVILADGDQLEIVRPVGGGSAPPLFHRLVREPHDKLSPDRRGSG